VSPVKYELGPYIPEDEILLTSSPPLSLFSLQMFKFYL
jgi:hypothetical protein